MTATGLRALTSRGARRGIARLARSLGAGVLAAGVILAAWQLAISLTGASDYITKTPLDVLAYLFIDDASAPTSAGGRRAAILGLVGVTVGHAIIGLALGVGLGLIAAIAMAASRTARAMFLPLALFLQTVPLIAMAPVIYAVFGSGVLTAAVISGVVTFFPLLVNLTAGFGAAGRDVVDVVTVYGGRRFDLLWRVSLPSALPYLFAGLRIAAPATVGGAMLYEYLFTFEGLGAAMTTSRQFSDYALMWTIVAVSVVLSLASYGLVALVERLVLGRRYPPTEQPA